MAKEKKPLSSETKLELAKNIAEKSEHIKKTYENIEQGFMKVYRMISQWIDTLLFNQKFAKLTAIALSVIMYLIINGTSQDSLFMNNIKQSVELSDVVVTSNVSESVYEISGLPETVDVMVRGDASDVQFASQQKSNYRVLADLSDLPEGKHEVRLEPVNFSNKVEVTLNPSTAVVTIKKKISRSYRIGYDYINTDKLDKIYALGEPQFSQNEVIVRASEDTMNQISYVKALIDLNGVKADFEKDAILVAYDQTGSKVDVDILPEKVSVSVNVTMPNKEVSLVVVPEGVLADGKAIDSYTLDHSSITVYAPEDVLETLKEIKIKVPVDKISEDTTITMPITLPNGVTKGSVSKVKVALKIKEAQSKEISDVPITYTNYNDNFKIILGDTKASTKVMVSATKSVLETIKKEQIHVVMDLSQCNAAGTYEVPLKVSGDNALATYTLANKTLKITLEEK